MFGRNQPNIVKQLSFNLKTKKKKKKKPGIEPGSPALQANYNVGIAFFTSWTTREALSTLLSYKKKYIWVSSNEVDEPRAYYTKWSQKESNK